MEKIASSEPEIDIEDLLKDVMQFDKYQSTLGDIYKLKSYNDLKMTLSNRVKSNKEKTREGANMILDNEEFLIVAPTTHESCAYYGHNTKWCIVASEEWWNTHYYKSTIVILLDKRDGQKYAIIGNHYGEYIVYDKNDNTLPYSSMVGDEDDQWPEYVQEAVENYMSSDDPESREDTYHAMLIDKFVKNEGTDSIWENYIDNLNSEYNLEDSPSSLNDFKTIANGYGLDTDKLAELAISFVREQLYSGGDVDDLGYFRRNEELRIYLNDMGNYPKIEDTLEQIDVAYVHNQRNIDYVLKILQQAIPPQEYARLYNIGTIDEEIWAAITKYNKMLNSQQQQTFANTKESVQIRNINDIIYVLNRTGHENVGGYLETLIGIKESINPPVCEGCAVGISKQDRFHGWSFCNESALKYTIVRENTSKFNDKIKNFKQNGSEINKKMRLIERGYIPQIEIDAEDGCILEGHKDLIAAWKLKNKNIDVKYITKPFLFESKIKEIFNSNLLIDIEKIDDSHYVSKFQHGGESYTIKIERWNAIRPNSFTLRFYKDINSDNIAGFDDLCKELSSVYGISNLNSEFGVYSHVISAAKKFIGEHNPDLFAFFTDNIKKHRLYTKIIKQQLPPEYNCKGEEMDSNKGKDYVTIAYKKNIKFKKETKEKTDTIDEGYGAGIPEQDRLKIKNIDGSVRRWQIKSKNAPKTPLIKEDEELINGVLEKLFSQNN